MSPSRRWYPASPYRHSTYAHEHGARGVDRGRRVGVVNLVHGRDARDRQHGLVDNLVQHAGAVAEPAGRRVDGEDRRRSRPPTCSRLNVDVAVVPLPPRAVPGPRSVVPSKNSMLPVGTPPLPLVLSTVAVNVTDWPYVDALSDEPRRSPCRQSGRPR